MTIPHGAMGYMVQNSHYCRLTEIMGLQASLSKLPQQQLLKAASHLQHQGAEQAPDSYTSLKPQGGFCVITLSPLPFYRNVAQGRNEKLADVNLAPSSQSCMKGSNKHNFAV